MWVKINVTDLYYESQVLNLGLFLTQKKPSLSLILFNMTHHHHDALGTWFGMIAFELILLLNSDDFKAIRLSSSVLALYWSTTLEICVCRSVNSDTFCCKLSLSAINSDSLAYALFCDRLLKASISELTLVRSVSYWDRSLSICSFKDVVSADNCVDFCSKASNLD